MRHFIDETFHQWDIVSKRQLTIYQRTVNSIDNSWTFDVVIHQWDNASMGQFMDKTSHCLNNSMMGLIHETISWRDNLSSKPWNYLVCAKDFHLKPVFVLPSTFLMVVMVFSLDYCSPNPNGWYSCPRKRCPLSASGNCDWGPKWPILLSGQKSHHSAWTREL